MDKIKDENLAEQNIQKLKELFPAAFTEGDKIDFEVLKTLLGENIDEKLEKYQFTWNGKLKTIKGTQTPSTGTLVSVKTLTGKYNETGNLYIEGDNLEVLKLLQKTYASKVGVIYIDPPYNTGSDFVYEDNFANSIGNYKETTKQTCKFNPETNGRYHSDWINMMYSRLMLARNLLTEDGIIFMSIDDHEITNLIKISDEIFGEENYVNNFCWINNLKGRQISNFGAVQTYESILCYSKNANLIEQFRGEVDYLKKNMPFVYKGFDYETMSDDLGEFVIKNELYNTNSIFNETTRPNLVYNIHYNEKLGKVKFSTIHEDIDFVDFVKIKPKKNNDGIHKYQAWRWSKDKVDNELDDLYFVKHLDTYKIFTKIREFNFTNIKDIISNIENGNTELERLIGKGMFDYPKSTTLIKFLIKMTMKTDIIVLDFFSGSATTAHAVMQLNAEDGGNRKFIMVQLPELTDEKSEAYKAGYKNICEIGEERIRRAGDQIVRELSEKQKVKGLLDDDFVDPDKLDIGFKVFKLDSSNFTPFEGTREGIQASLDFETLDKARSEKDVLYEIMLKYGVFDKSIDEIIIEGKKVYSVGAGYLFVCLDKNVTDKVVNEIAKLKPKTVIFDETGFKDDNAKDNAIYALQKAGVEEVKSI